MTGTASRLLPALALLLGLAVIARPGRAEAKRPAWGAKATAEETTAGIESEVARGGSALRKQFGEAVSTAFAKTNNNGLPLDNALIDHERTKSRKGSIQRVTTMSKWGADDVSATRQVERSKGRMAFTSSFTRDGQTKSEAQHSQVVTDGSRRPRRLTVTNVRSVADASGARETEHVQEFTRGRFGRRKLAMETKRVARSGNRAAAGNQFETETTQTWGRRTKTEKVAVSNEGVQRVVRGEKKSYFGGRVAVSKQQAFGQKGKNPRERSLGVSRQVSVGGKTWNLGRQRAERGARGR